MKDMKNTRTSAQPASDDAIASSRLANFPITFFGATMGVFGLGLAFRAGDLGSAATAVTGIGVVLLFMLSFLYGLKAIRYPRQVAEEWHHPIKLAFFPAAIISILLLSLLLQKSLPGVSVVLWGVGAGAQAILTIVIVTAWISHRAFGPAMLSPAWFIPAVGNVIVPLGGAHLGFIDVSWYFFSVGTLFWIVLLTLVFNRLVFHDPLPGKLKPTLVILVAPPSVAFLAWIGLNGGQIDAVAHILFSIAVFFAALVALQVPSLLKLPFVLSFWALSFPLAALTTAVFRYASITGGQPFYVVGFALLVVLVVTIIALSVQTIRAALAGNICQPE